MTAVAAPTRPTPVTVAKCSRCGDTGWLRPPGTACDCDARPFEVATGQLPAVTEYRSYRPRTSEQSAAMTDLELIVDRAMAWSSRNLSAVVRLAHWQPYLRDGGDPTHTVRHLLAAADTLASAAGDLDQLINDLRTAAITTEGLQ